MQDAIWLLLISTVFALLVWVFFRVLFDGSPGYHEPPEPLDATGWTLVVDGSNFAHRADDVQLDHLEDVISSLHHYFRNADVRVYCDANLRHKFDNNDRRRFERLIDQESPRIHETHGQSADDVILRYAGDNPNCVVVSNDWFGKGDEVEKRRGIPLLRVEQPLSSDAFPHRYVNIFDDPDHPDRRKKVPVHDVLGR